MIETEQMFKQIYQKQFWQKQQVISTFDRLSVVNHYNID